MKSILLCAAISFVALSALPAAAEECVVMTRDLTFPDRGAALPALERGRVYPCAAVTGQGFLVGCRDGDGAPRIALLPLRSEWGHVTATAWTQAAELDEHTLRVRNPQALKPGHVLLEQGKAYTLIETRSGGFLVHYRFGDYSRKLAVPRDAARVLVEEEAEPDPAALREREVGARVASVREQRDRLMEALERTEQDQQRLAALLEQLEEAQVERSALRAALAEAEASYAELVRELALAGDVREDLDRRIETRARERGTLRIRLARLQAEAERLKLLLAQLLTDEVEIEELKLEVGDTRGELRGAVKAAEAGALSEEARELQALMDLVRHKREELLVELNANRPGQQKVRSLIDILDAAARRTVALRDEVARLEEQLEALREKIEEIRAVIEEADREAPAAPAEEQPPGAVTPLVPGEV